MYSDRHMCVFFTFISFNKILIYLLAFICQCPTGYYGILCENRNYCTPNPCSNNGFCLQTVAGYICSCSYPYTGTNCQLSTLMHFFKNIISMFFLVISTTTTTTTTIAIRAPCGPACACIVTPCPIIVVVNPCLPNPWLDFELI